ncbi:MAG: T9SS type A sorting domain-containing protein [Ignavibacteriae bacterium]|nr:T9SS type A sorting domain-containing protein [Ignavibacteriota bacterium]
MKKVIALLMLVFLFSLSAESQIIKMSQGFEGTTFPPAGWTSYNVLGTNVWTRAASTITALFPPFPNGTNCAAVDYQTTGGNDYLVTQKINGVVAGDSLVFFWVKRYSDGPYPPDSCIVRVSTTDSLVSSFTNVLTRICVHCTPVGTQTWSRVALPLSTFAGQNIFVAFEHKDVDGHGMGIDSVFVHGSNATPVPTGTWTEQTSGLTTVLYSVSAVNDDVAWVCGASGKVLRTTNKGLAWTNVSGNLPTTYAMYNIFAWDANLAIVTGVSGSTTAIYQTSNGGVNWTTANSHAGFGDNLYMSSATNGYFIGDPIGGNWDLLSSTNAGLNWATWSTLATTNTSGTYNNGAFFNGTRVYFESVGQSHILFSSNMGTNWTQQTITLAELTAIWFNSTTDGLAGGSSTSPGLLKTVNGGTNWTALTSPYPTNSISGIVGAQNTYWVSQQGTGISITTNFGTSFTSAYTAPAGSFYHMTKSRAGATIWAVRSNGGISRYGLPISGVTPNASEIPAAYSLDQNYPNPFNPVTKISYALPKSGFTTLKVYDITGKEVVTLVNEVKNAGTYSIDFDGAALSSGTYFYRLESNGFVSTKKMLLIK